MDGSASSGPDPRAGDDPESTMVMQTGEQPSQSAPPAGQGARPRSPGGGRPPKRWFETRSGAILGGSLGGLLVAALVAVFLVLTVDSDEDAAAGDDDGNGAQETATPNTEATPDDGGPAVPVNFDGTWITNFATMDLRQEGATVTGQYSGFVDGATPQSIEGVITDRTLDGAFDGSNPIRFQMANDGRSFTGHWADPQGDLHEWCGSIDPPLPDGCGYSGEWQVKNFPPPADLEGDTILMTQDGDTVKMRFDSASHGEVDFDLDFDGSTLAQARGTASFPSGPEIVFEFLVTAEHDWNALGGTWRSGGQSGEWCAFREGAEPPC